MHSNDSKCPGKGTGYPAPSPQSRTCRTTASGSSVLILLTKPEAKQATPRLAHNFAALRTVLCVVDDSGFRKRVFVENRGYILFPINFALVTSTAQPILPIPFRFMGNALKRPIVTNNTKILVMATQFKA